MDTIIFRVDKTFCGDCVMGLRRFLQGIDGVASVQIAGQIMSISFDTSGDEGRHLEEHRRKQP